LLAFLVEVAALQAQGAGGVGHVVMMAAQFGKQHFPFKRFYALPQRSISTGSSGFAVAGRRKGHTDFIGSDRIIPGKQQNTFDNVP
jgi:hypothetical protein